MDIRNHVYRHKKRGSLYRVIGTARLIVRDPGKPIKDDDLMCIFNGGDDTFIAPLAPFTLIDNPNRILYTVQIADGDVLIPGDILVMYIDTESKHWARKLSEFLDGRFERIESMSSILNVKTLPTTPELYDDATFGKLTDIILASGIDPTEDKATNVARAENTLIRLLRTMREYQTTVIQKPDAPHRT